MARFVYGAGGVRGRGLEAKTRQGFAEVAGHRGRNGGAAFALDIRIRTSQRRVSRGGGKGRRRGAFPRLATGTSADPRGAVRTQFGAAGCGNAHATGKRVEYV